MNKKRMFSLFPIFAIPLAVILSFGLESCSKENVVEINSNTAKEEITLYDYGSDDSYDLTFNNVINLQTISNANKNAKKFVVKGDIIDTPIFIPLGSDFEVYGQKESRIISTGIDNGHLNMSIIIGTNVINDSRNLNTNVKLHNLSIDTANNGGSGINGVFINHATNVEIYDCQISTSQSDQNNVIDATYTNNLNVHDNILTNNGVGSNVFLVSFLNSFIAKNNIVQNSCSSAGNFMISDVNNAEICDNFISSKANGYTTNIIDITGEQNGTLDFKNNIINMTNTNTEHEERSCSVLAVNDGLSIDFKTSSLNAVVSDIPETADGGDHFVPSYGTYHLVTEPPLLFS
jgi:hypothetical protein